MEPKTKYKLSDMVYDEVSVVALGANQDSDIVIFKSERRVTPRGDGHEAPDHTNEIIRANATIALARAKTALSKANPNHSPKDGKFTTGGGGAKGGKGKAGGGFKVGDSVEFEVKSTASSGPYKGKMMRTRGKVVGFTPTGMVKIKSKYNKYTVHPDKLKADAGPDAKRSAGASYGQKVTRPAKAKANSNGRTYTKYGEGSLYD